MLSAKKTRCTSSSVARPGPRRIEVRLHAARWDGASNMKAGFAAAALTALLLSPSAHAATLAEAAAERELAIASQKQQLEYLLQQQENARRAALMAQRKAVEQQVSSVQTALQQKLTEQRANALAAEKNGDKGLADVIKANGAQLEEKAEQVRVAAAKMESRLDRAEMLQKAKAAAEKQQVERAAQEAVDDINEALDRWLESVNNMK
ncbi:hypothetical protein Agub_g208 [Astrephomene gubernaculifera]|uniref:Uncharacterized protein n=1 Tax=Astrephomene gubernaculifera TaxID=47775 RepID=A0AAD3HG98_9CHLO|nr:hypothetical protein Agub_g208 [Astrephomene gubernaculifera]